jgi:hypothetical protein
MRHHCKNGKNYSTENTWMSKICLKEKVERITNIQKDFINSIRYQKRNLKLIIGGPGRSSGVGNSNL